MFDLTNKLIVPDVIANTPSEFLKVTYSNDEEVVPGSTLTYEEILGKKNAETPYVSRALKLAKNFFFSTLSIGHGQAR